ncbi:ATP-binding protein [Streptomyces sp. NPDC058953]|uniref:ATP-binding protein n=1 Tax=Streptomyces sp. NPDC058953 TaxID=3346676 RepID=UPI0036A27510
MWCLVAVAATAVVAVVLLVGRNRALGAKRREIEAALGQQQRLTEGQLSVAQAELRRMLDDHDATVKEAEEASEDSTKAVLKGAARFLQSLAAEQMALLEEIQRKYGGHSVLGDLLEVNHANAQMARKAQGIADMCGAPIGRRSRPASVYDVVRSAQGQIRNFSRVDIMQQTGFALKASAVSPVALAVAELLDNAASFSQSDAPIEVTFQHVQKNLCIVIDDAGVSMNDEERQKATALLSGDVRPRLSQLGNQPKFGFPVIGLLARQHGFQVDVTGVSRYGGVRAVVLLPEELWTMEEVPQPVAETEAPVRDIREAEGRSQNGGRTMHGLPKRGSRQAPRNSLGTGRDGVRPATRNPDEAARATGRSLGAFQRGSISGRNLDSPPFEGAEDT